MLIRFQTDSAPVSFFKFDFTLFFTCQTAARVSATRRCQNFFCSDTLAPGRGWRGKRWKKKSLSPWETDVAHTSPRVPSFHRSGIYFFERGHSDILTFSRSLIFPRGKCKALPSASFSSRSGFDCETLQYILHDVGMFMPSLVFKTAAEKKSHSRFCKSLLYPQNHSFFFPRLS